MASRVLSGEVRLVDQRYVGTADVKLVNKPLDHFYGLYESRVIGEIVKDVNNVSFGILVDAELTHEEGDATVLTLIPSDQLADLLDDKSRRICKYRIHPNGAFQLLTNLTNEEKYAAVGKATFLHSPTGKPKSLEEALKTGFKVHEIVNAHITILGLAQQVKILNQFLTFKPVF